MKGLVFDTENQMQFKDFGEPLLDNLQKEVGGCIEVVHPKYLPEGLCMVIDDEGLLKGYAIRGLCYPWPRTSGRCHLQSGYRRHRSSWR